MSDTAAIWHAGREESSVRQPESQSAGMTSMPAQGLVAAALQ